MKQICRQVLVHPRRVEVSRTGGSFPEVTHVIGTVEVVPDSSRLTKSRYQRLLFGRGENRVENCFTFAEKVSVEKLFRVEVVVERMPQSETQVGICQTLSTDNRHASFKLCDFSPDGSSLEPRHNIGMRLGRRPQRRCGPGLRRRCSQRRV